MNTIKFFEYSLSAPITVLSYTALLPFGNFFVEWMVYFGLVLNVLVGGIVNKTLGEDNLTTAIATISGSLITAATFGTLAYYLFRIPFSSESYLIYSIIGIFILSRVRYFILLLNKENKDGEKLWISKQFINIDFHDRLFLFVSLIVLMYFGWY